MAIAKRKKRFFDVEMPVIGKETQLLAFEISELEGRHITYDLTRILRGKSILLQLKVHVNENQATSTPEEARLLPYFLRRAVRKGTDYIEDSFMTDSKDYKLILKPLLVTRRRVSREVRKALREKAREEIIEYVKSRPAEQIFEEILKNRMQKEISLKLKKIYPLSLCEIKTIKLGKKLEGKKETKEEKQIETQKEETTEESKVEKVTEEKPKKKSSTKEKKEEVKEETSESKKE